MNRSSGLELQPGLKHELLGLGASVCHAASLSILLALLFGHADVEVLFWGLDLPTRVSPTLQCPV